MRTKCKSKPSKRRRSEFYISFQFWELDCAAFLHLSADATRVYMFLRKRLNFDASNNGAVPFSHRNASDALRSGWRRGSNALAELEHFGFIKLRNEGVPGTYVRQAGEWQLTAFPCGGQEASKDFMRWQGDVFEPPYRRSEKQRPIFTVKTPRRHREDASPASDPSEQAKNAESVVTVKTLRQGEHRHREDTSTITRLRGPEESEAREALTTGGPAAKRPWTKPSYVDAAIPRGPASARLFGAWLRDERIARGVALRILADALSVEVEDLDEMELGRIQMAVGQRRRAEVALAWGELVRAAA